MSSSDENSGDEQSRNVTLQIKLKDGTLKEVQTKLGATIKEFRLLVAEQTGVPPHQQNLVVRGQILKDPRTIRSYELEPDQIIDLGILASSSNNETPCSSTFEQYATLDPAAYNVVFMGKFIEQLDVAKLLESPVILQYILLFLVYVEISTRMLYSVVGETDNVDAHIEESSWLKSVSFGHCCTISLATVLHKLSQNFHMNLVGSSRSANGSQSISAPNRNPLPNPWASSSYIGSSSSVGQACVSDEISISNLQKDCSEIADKLMPVITSDSTLLRKCKEQGIIIENAYAVISDPQSSKDNQYSQLDRLALEVCEYFIPIEMKLRELNHGMDSNSSCPYCGGGDDCSAENATLVDWLSPELEEMEHMGFMDRRQNLLALIFSGCKLDDAIKMFPKSPKKVNPGEEEEEAAILVEQFASELAELKDMGFRDSRRILTALLSSGGNKQKAIEMLLDQPNRMI